MLVFRGLDGDADNYGGGDGDDGGGGGCRHRLGW